MVEPASISADAPLGESPVRATTGGTANKQQQLGSSSDTPNTTTCALSPITPEQTPAARRQAPEFPRTLGAASGESVFGVDGDGGSDGNSGNSESAGHRTRRPSPTPASPPSGGRTTPPITNAATILFSADLSPVNCGTAVIGNNLNPDGAGTSGDSANCSSNINDASIISKDSADRHDISVDVEALDLAGLQFVSAADAGGLGGGSIGSNSNRPPLSRNRGGEQQQQQQKEEATKGSGASTEVSIATLQALVSTLETRLAEKDRQVARAAVIADNALGNDDDDDDDDDEEGDDEKHGRGSSSSSDSKKDAKIRRMERKIESLEKEAENADKRRTETSSPPPSSSSRQEESEKELQMKDRIISTLQSKISSMSERISQVAIEESALAKRRVQIEAPLERVKKENASYCERHAADVATVSRLKKEVARLRGLDGTTVLTDEAEDGLLVDGGVSAVGAGAGIAYAFAAHRIGGGDFLSDEISGELLGDEFKLKVDLVSDDGEEEWDESSSLAGGGEGEEAPEAVSPRSEAGAASAGDNADVVATTEEKEEEEERVRVLTELLDSERRDGAAMRRQLARLRVEVKGCYGLTSGGTDETDGTTTEADADEIIRNLREECEVYATQIVENDRETGKVKASLDDAHLDNAKLREEIGVLLRNYEMAIAAAREDKNDSSRDHDGSLINPTTPAVVSALQQQEHDLVDELSKENDTLQTKNRSLEKEVTAKAADLEAREREVMKLRETGRARERNLVQQREEVDRLTILRLDEVAKLEEEKEALAVDLEVTERRLAEAELHNKAARTSTATTEMDETMASTVASTITDSICGFDLKSHGINVAEDVKKWMNNEVVPAVTQCMEPPPAPGSSSSSKK